MSTVSTLPHARLLLARHGQSEANAHSIFTGWSDPPLTVCGVGEARAIARKLQAAGAIPDRIFSSSLLRATDTVDVICEAMKLAVVVVTSEALNERDYGELTGLNKDAAEQRFGADQVHAWRRSYALAPPQGESLRDTAARVLAYYVQSLLPAVMEGGTTLVVAHGNSLRALVMALTALSPSEVEDFEIPTGTIIAFDLALNSAVVRHASLN